MKMLTLFFLLLPGYYGLAQKPATQYLFVTLEKEGDFSQSTAFGNGVIYYYFTTEKGADSSDPVYQLLPFNGNRKAKNDKAGFYKGYGDTSLHVYNYFQTPTQAFNYLQAAGWEVVHTINEVQSDTDILPVRVMSVWSKTKFMLRKNVRRPDEVLSGQ